MEPQLFTDGIGRITVIGGVVRLDMVTYSPNETDANGRPRQVFTQRIVMGTDAFLRSAEKVVEIVQQLTRAHGQQAAAQAPAPQPPAPQPAAAPKPNLQPVPTAPRGAPPYVTGPLFPAAPDEPPQPPKPPFP
ncbi:MAG: hypothetical protein H0U98_02910 [Alphaproteobacteria bacterium]|nr:hypothetical protein [Alphaproteobacteria bacterium]